MKTNVCLLTFLWLGVLMLQVVLVCAGGRFSSATTAITNKSLHLHLLLLDNISRGGARATAASRSSAAAASTRSSSSSSSSSSSASTSSSSSRKTASSSSSSASPPPSRRSSSSSSSSSGVTVAVVTKAEFPTLGTATIPLEVFNLIKAIVGAGVLALPAGIAAFGNAPSALIPALLLLTCIGTLSANGFSMIGQVCAMTHSTSYRQAWSRSVGERTSWIPALACLLVTFCSVSTYSMILAETIPAIVQAIFGLSVSRTNALLSVTSFILLPLCLLKSLRSLAPFSFIGILGMIYTSTVMLVRWICRSYATPTSPLRMQVPTHLVPRFGTNGWKAAFSPNIAILISMLSTAFMSHYHAPRFYWELKDNTMARYNKVVILSFTGAIVLMAVTATAGFATFGAASDSLILNNYSLTDPFMSLSRLAVTVSLLFSYPLAFSGLRQGFLDLFADYILGAATSASSSSTTTTMEQRRQAIFTPVTIGLLTLITSMAFVVKDIRILLALSGATWGNCVIYLFPSLMMIKTILASSKSSSSSSSSSSSPSSRSSTRSATTSSSSSRRGVIAGMSSSTLSSILLPSVTGIVGLILGVIGTGRALQTLL